MNERILELLYEAGGQYGGEHFTTGQTVIYTEEVDYEKFAELLIQECANIDYKNASDGEFSNDDSYLISKVIKQHFGAEE